MGVAAYVTHGDINTSQQRIIFYSSLKSDKQHELEVRDREKVLLRSKKDTKAGGTPPLLTLASGQYGWAGKRVY